MTIVRNPARAWTRVPAATAQAELRQLFGRVFGDEQAAADAAPSRWAPRVDIREEAGRFVILADLPGVDPQSIEVQMDAGELTISGERAIEAPGEGARTLRSERSQGTFQRRFTLPDSVDADGIVATGRHGVLEVVIPKKPEIQPRRIQVQ
ncbi:Hsp20/alpha crystallin family protein [Coralloluteibacterium stylophorae]|uniref:Hsp20 family protein n=1 Tax=Coralloluteibacterium stylophorae TaxID=1776034 RepID=A0A8J8AXP4_9GAMM|nr:Hsp20/alpha crystallin family protein [Coralloluteibacterium stylophorae]MBS7456295.1 Hsp20 family protein [Coralloluteibacterium stylophorae]